MNTQRQHQCARRVARAISGFLFALLAGACSDSNGPGGPGNELTLAEAAGVAGLYVGVAIEPDMSAERRTLALQSFTSATPENALKWQPLSPTPDSYRFDEADTVVALAEGAGLRMRGHALFWQRLNGLPDWLVMEVETAPDPAARLQALMENHAHTVVARYAGRIAQWDVVNEPLALLGGEFDPGDNFFYRVLGEQYLDIAFHTAHAADPSAELFLNETAVEILPEKFEGLVDLANRLLDRGVPLHGIGLQGHFFTGPPDAATLQGQLERIAALGLKVELTEVDIPLPLFASTPDPLKAQAAAYNTVFASCLAVAACTGVTMWGLDDGHTWLDSFILSQANAPNRPLLFDAELKPKPAYFSVRDLLLVGTGG